jgi:hypothetical protein
MIWLSLITTLIKEFEAVMSDIFQVVPQTTPNSSHPSHFHPTHAYIKLQGDFLAQNFGHYTLRFI